MHEKSKLLNQTINHKEILDTFLRYGGDNYIEVSDFLMDVGFDQYLNADLELDECWDDDLIEMYQNILRLYIKHGLPIHETKHPENADEETVRDGLLDRVLIYKKLLYFKDKQTSKL